MEKQIYVAPDGAPAVGPYSPAVGIGDFVFLSGHLALDTDGKIHGYTPKDQTQKALENLQATLAAAGLTLADVVKTTIFLKDMDEFGAVNEVYGQFFAEPYPARSTVEVARLPKDMHVEIEAIAYRG
jgi:2-iminobutanoate/2-iminopropanoate deaminase